VPSITTCVFATETFWHKTGKAARQSTAATPISLRKRIRMSSILHGTPAARTELGH
jgi:hypothetical protein